MQHPPEPASVPALDWFDQAVVGMAVTDREGTYLRVNEAFARLHGIAGSRLVGRSCLDVTHPDDHELVLGNGIDLLEGAPHSRFDKRIVRQDGSTLWVRVTDRLVGGYILTQFEDVDAETDLRLALAAAERELRRNFEGAAVGSVLLSTDGFMRRANSAFGALVGRAPDELVGRPVGEVIHPHDRVRALRAARQLISGRATRSDAEFRLLQPDGSPLWVRAVSAPILDDGGALDRLSIQVTDISNERASAEELRVERARFSALLEHSHDILAVVDANGGLTYVSPGGLRRLGLERTMEGTANFITVLHPDDRTMVADRFAALLGRPGALDIVDFRMRDGAGRWRNVEAVATNRLNDPDIAGVVANLRDVTDRKHATDRMTWLAEHDELTGLANRKRFVDALSGWATGLGATAVLFIDLDRFKTINDTMGHAVGDTVLRVTADRLRTVVRDGDLLARLGGDEFVVLVEGAERTEIEAMAVRINEAVSQPVVTSSGNVRVSASVGVATGAGPGLASLLDEADAAMYRAKQHGRNRFALFDASFRTEACRRRHVEEALRAALDAGTMALHLQPIVSLAEGTVVGWEALPRLADDAGQPIAPIEFVAVAEEADLIDLLGLHVLAMAAERVVARASSERAFVTVNVSPRQLARDHFVTHVLETVDQAGLAPGRLVLELTESALIPNDPKVVQNLNELSAAGVVIALDDFGTGYSSLAHLREFPIGLVKIDRSFVAGSVGTGPDQAIIRAIVSLAHALDLPVVAEGIERTEALQVMRQVGCDYGQGFLFDGVDADRAHVG